MAVYKRSYKPYAGALTGERSRWLVLARYALGRLFESRLVIGFSVASYLVPIVLGTIIYLRYNLSALSTLQIDADFLIPVDSTFFAVFLNAQGFLSFLFTAYAAPGLIGPDLSNNALPLYLCRPITRAEYVMGKLAVLFIPLSLITWVPGLLLWSMQAGLNAEGWGMANLRLISGVLGGSFLWIALISLLGLALSAWVKWRIAASALLFGIFFITAALSAIVNEVLGTKLGFLLDPGHLVAILWANMLGVSPNRTLLGDLLEIRTGDEVPLWAAWLMVAAICGACVALLNRKLRAREVVS